MVVGRYAPSPTGDIHLGNARTALAAWLVARAAGGRVLLRIEDNDPGRSRRAFEERQREDLAWLGLDFDGPVVRQSERTQLYRAAIARLEARGLVYPCFCTRRELRSLPAAPHAGDDDGPPYPGTCRDLTSAERAARVAAGRRPALRVRVPAGVVRWHDLRHGDGAEDVAALRGDQLVQRADGAFAYQLAVVVDDAAQGVTQVVRGDDLRSSCGRQRLLQELLGLPPVTYLHVPLVLGPDGERLSKRHGAVAVRALRQAGLPADAVVGALAASLGLAADGERVAPGALVARVDPAALGAVDGPLDLAVPPTDGTHGPA